ncbi:MAG: bZIP transcription factor, partial [Chloroflexi bacterium]|nr:bZIP transcription factor [Chloroflexota bacterium]
QQDGQERLRELEAELAQTKAREQELQAEVARLRQQLMESSCALVPLINFSQIPRHHQYSLGHIFLFLLLVLSAAIRLRAASRALQLCLSFFQLPWSGPSYHTGRLWLLRLGYYKLTRPKVQADDWVWIVDHTIQLGAEKCLVIVGLRLSALPPSGQCLSHAAVEPLALLPVQHSNSTVVCEQLESVVVQTGVPREIIADHGSDLKLGIEKFCQAPPQTSPIYQMEYI